ncbi:multisubstrate pseudouridine synthase 7-like [Chenopodium quinoa]|uniref:multisubstrate pseudouridine synthase 7-like n=1 Tax=Chenopodium quinoa TaxID=63459 RepID=UPI000B792909|nr:multisubstrate pseudouridine synthase 7-like [Chenopodium quinoa]
MLRNRTLTFLCSKLVKPYSLLPPSTTPTTTATMASTAVDNLPADSQTSITKPPLKSVDEPDVGILCYISHLPGFRGILKQRYSDFIVNEVDLDGNVVHLTSLHVSPELAENKEEIVAEKSDKSYTEEIESFRLLVGDEDADRLKELIEKISAGVDHDISPLVLSPSSDKVHRTAVHNFFKEKLKFLVTDTIDGPKDSSKCIRVRPNSSGNQNNGRNFRKRKDRNEKPFDKRGSHDWPEHLGKFLRFHLYKENKDTQEVLRLIGKMLGVQPKSFGFSGTKDKRSVSTQQVTMFKQRASKLASLNAKLIGIKLGDFCYVREGLQLGQLFGNRFTITLRGVTADSEDTIKASADALGKHGFINYFGLQRFGSGSIPTHLIGAALLRGEWKAAIDMILDPREGEREAVRKIREQYKESNNVDGALRRLPHHMVAERSILLCLKKSPGNYQQALKAIPRTMRMMYVHSYQSYLWNHAASVRLQKYGADSVVVGDLVYCKEDSGEIITAPNGSEEDIIDEVDNISNLEDIEVDVPDEKIFSVKAVDEEDLLKQKYTIDDVVLPLPGSRVMYPANAVADVYHDLAKKDNISLTESVHNVKEFSITSMTGAYRRVFQKPIDFEWEVLKYTDASTPLAETDLDILAKTEPAIKYQKVDKTNGSNSCNAPDKCKDGTPDNTESDGPNQATQTALKLSFTLPSSCYATMAIRELLKTSTSVAFHKTLNDQV